MRTVDVNGVEFVVGTHAELEQVSPYDAYLLNAQDDPPTTIWYKQAPGFSGFENLLRAAGHDPHRIDLAVPQDWLNRFRSRLPDWGEICWSYESDNILGLPLFEVEVRALVEALLSINQLVQGEEDQIRRD